MKEKCHCVVVDDDSNFLAFLRLILLQISPHLVIVGFQSGMEALAYVGKNPVDLVITDSRMPRFTGLQLTSAIRTFNPSVPIVVVSAENVGYEARASGASDFLIKHSLTAELRSVLDKVGVA